MIFRNNKQLNARGFTLVEVMVAVMVMSIGLVGSLTLITYNLRNISSEENKIIAAGLAAEGIELARNIRDTNWLRGDAWDANFGFSDAAPVITKTRLRFFCGGLAVYSEHQGSHNWEDTLTSGSGCNGPRCRIFAYRLDIAGSKPLCYSDNFGNGFRYPPDETGVDYRAVNPRMEFYRLVTAERIDSNSVKIESSVKYTENGVDYLLPIVTETLYNWR